MLEHFYFDLESGEETIRDEEGVEADRVDEALDEARNAIAEIAYDTASKGSNKQWTVVIRNAVSILVGRLPIIK